MAKMADRSSHSIKCDIRQRSQQDWERGRKARKIGNPRYKRYKIVDKNGVKRTVFKLRPLK